MQQAGRDHEADAVGQRVRRLGQLRAMGVTVEDRDAPTSTAATHKGGRSASATTAPSATADAAMPISTPGSGTPLMPSRPPNAITTGNTTGSSHIAGCPRNAPHRPTATMATTWSKPEDRVREAARKPPTTPSCASAKSGKRIAAAATSQAACRAPVSLPGDGSSLFIT